MAAQRACHDGRTTAAIAAKKNAGVGGAAAAGGGAGAGTGAHFAWLSHSAHTARAIFFKQDRCHH